MDRAEEVDLATALEGYRPGEMETPTVVGMGELPPSIKLTAVKVATKEQEAALNGGTDEAPRKERVQLLPRQVLQKRNPGTHRLKKLTTRHLAIIARHLGGMTGKEIAVDLGVTQAMVYYVINDPLAQPLIDNFREGVRKDLQALQPKVVDVINEALDHPSANIRLVAVDKFVKMAQADTDRNDGGRAAGVQINIINGAREKLALQLRQAATKAGIMTIEGQAEEVLNAG